MFYQQNIVQIKAVQFQITAVQFSFCSLALGSQGLDEVDPKVAMWPWTGQLWHQMPFVTVISSKTIRFFLKKCFHSIWDFGYNCQEWYTLSDRVTRLVRYRLSSGRDPFGESQTRGKQSQENKRPNHWIQLCLESTTLGLSVIWANTFSLMFNWFWIGVYHVQLIGSWVIEPSKDTHNLKQKLPKFLTLNSRMFMN